MANNKKKRNTGSKSAKPAPKKNNAKYVWIGLAVAAAAIVGLIALSSGGSDGQTTASGTPEEQGYLGRFLPAGYEEPKVADITLYTEAVAMSPATAVQDESAFSLTLDAVLSAKIVRFDYTRPGGDSLPMIAYVRPSGSLFVGVSYCPPCEGEGQRIEADGTLTCESCGTKRDLETNAGISGACKLYPLDEVPSTVSGDDIVVDTGVLDTWTAQPLDRPIG